MVPDKTCFVAFGHVCGLPSLPSQMLDLSIESLRRPLLGAQRVTAIVSVFVVFVKDACLCRFPAIRPRPKINLKHHR